MDYVTVRELRDKSGEVWQRVESGEEFVVTRNGLPCALLLHAEPAEVEDLLRAHRAARLGAVVKRLQQQVRERGSEQLTEEDIQAEVDAVRRERAASLQGVSG
jgi:prevent-host-death family protein